MALLWRQVTLSSTLPVAEVQGRLAAGMSEWGGQFWGFSPPPPPWTDGRFIACPGAGFWFNIPMVVEGTVKVTDGTTQVSALIRPHGLAAVSPFLISAFILAAMGRADTGLLPMVPLALVWSWTIFWFWLNIAEKAPAIREVLAAASGGPDVLSS